MMNELLMTAVKRAGYTEEYMEKVRDARHGRLLDADRFSEFLYRNQGLVYTILPDFDTDGDCSGIIGFAGMSEMGFKCHLYTPSPKAGYGFGKAVVDHLLGTFPDTQVIVTCDNGIDCHEGVAYAKSKGLFVLVTDHHPQDEGRPLVAADVVVDPMRLDDTYEHPGICGAFVLWQCLYDYAVRYREPFMQEQIWRLRVFAGIATVGDQMPVMYENRQIVREAILFCRSMLADENGFLEGIIHGCGVYQSAFRGLMEMLRGLEEQGRADHLDEETFAFYISPMMNAAKRMSDSVYPVYRLFFGSMDAEERQEAFQDLWNTNEERKAAAKDYYIRMISDIDQEFAPYLYFSDAPAGILGLLASRAQSENPDGPVMVVARDGEGIWRGSGRSPEWFPFRETMAGMPGGFGSLSIKGHAHAFGCSIGDADCGRVCQYIRGICERYLEEHPKPKVPKAALVLGDDREICDFQFDLMDVVSYAYSIRRFGPFGKGFERPPVLLVLDKDSVEVSAVGKEKNHTKCVHTATGFPVLSWNQDARVIPLHSAVGSDDIPGCDCRYYWVLGDVELSEFNGVSSIQFTGKFV